MTIFGAVLAVLRFVLALEKLFSKPLSANLQSAEFYNSL
jgi:hypothetical protein